MLLRNIHLWIKTGTTPTQKGQETDYPFRKSSILCCSVIKFLEPRVSQFWAIKETSIKNLCCSRIIKYFCAAQKSLHFYFLLRIGTNKNISTHLPCSGMTQKVQTVQGEQVLLKLHRYLKSFSTSVAQPTSAVKKNSILIKTRRSAATSRPPPPPPAASQSPKSCPRLLW